MDAGRPRPAVEALRSGALSPAEHRADGCQTRPVRPRRLLLIRHARAAGGPVDRERPLSAEGVRQAAALGAWLAQAGLVPDRVLVSPARRAVQTWERAGAALSSAVPPIGDARIGDNTVEALLAVPPAVFAVRDAMCPASWTWSVNSAALEKITDRRPAESYPTTRRTSSVGPRLHRTIQAVASTDATGHVVTAAGLLR